MAATADAVEAATVPLRWPASPDAAAMIERRRALSDDEHERSVMGVLEGQAGRTWRENPGGRG